MWALVTKAIPPVAIRVFQRATLSANHRKARAIKHNSKLHFGCGSNIKKGWVNIDFFGPADIRMDLRRSLPIHDEIASMVYSEHFLEHLDYPEPAGSFVRECFRVLERGGTFSVGVPDTEWPLRSYATDHDYMREAKARKWHPEWCVTELEHINCHFRQGTDHRFAYDYETLKRLIERSGFVNVRRRDPDPSLDLEHRAFGTLYVDADKQ